MGIVLSSVLPIILILLLGNLIRVKQFLPNEFWGAADKLTYYILFPALIILKVSDIDLSKIALTKLLIFIVILFLLAALMSFMVYKLINGAENQFSSIYQAIVRFNSYIYFAISAQLWGNDGLALSALVAGFAIPIVNVSSIASFSVGKEGFSITRMLNSIIKNPLIIATMIGFLCNHFKWLLPDTLEHSFESLSKAALPLALLSVGASIQIKTLIQKNDHVSIKALWITSIARLFVMPICAVLLVSVLQIAGPLRESLILFAAIPTATSAYILSKQMGGDAKLMASLITFETVLSAASLILWIIVVIHL